MQNFLVFVLAVRFRLKKAYVADGITRGTMSRQVKLVQSQRKDQNQKIWNIQGRKSIVSMKFLIFSGKKFPIFFGKFFRCFSEKVSISDKYNFGVFSEKTTKNFLEKDRKKSGTSMKRLIFVPVCSKFFGFSPCLFFQCKLVLACV